jgi:LysM repeat protein
MQLTHEQAREMIQFQADAALGADRQRILKTHLDVCEACRAYSDSLKRTETILRQAMTRRWSLRAAPLKLETIRGESIFKSSQRDQLATRLAMIASAVLIFVVVSLGFANGTNPGADSQTPLDVPLIPTPSLQPTSTRVETAQSCGHLQYIIQANDTLENIANRFSISKAALMGANKLKSETILPGAEIIIPQCNSTPTGTVRPPTFTSTITPLLDTLSRTPDG